MANKKVSFPVKSLSITVKEDTLNILDSYAREREEERGVQVTRTAIVNEAIMEYLRNKNLLAKK